MAANIEAARQLMYFVGDEVDSKRRCDKEASMVKWFASEMAERVTSDALQIHGGDGYTKDLADRALLARRAADQDLRGHLGDPAPHHLGSAARQAEGRVRCFPTQQLFRIGMLMIVATGVIQVVAQLVLSRVMDVLPSPPLSRYPRFYMMTHSVTAVRDPDDRAHPAGDVVGAGLSLSLERIRRLQAARSISRWRASPRLGANDLALPPDHRMVGALEAAAGMLMFGWSTALLVGVVQRADHRPRP